MSPTVVFKNMTSTDVAWALNVSGKPGPPAASGTVSGGASASGQVPAGQPSYLVTSMAASMISPEFSGDTEITFALRVISPTDK